MPSTRRAALLGATVIATVLAWTPTAGAATQPLYQDSPPPGFESTARKVQRVAQRAPAVRRERARRGDLQPVAAYNTATRRWQVNFYADGDLRVQVIVADHPRRVLQTWTGIEAKWDIARPEKRKFGRELNDIYIWVPLCLVFLLPFFDPRRPFRLLHLDLLVLLAFGASQAYLDYGHIEVAMPLAYPVLAYLLVRMLVAGFRPRSGAGPLVPWLSTRVLVIGLIFLVSFRVTLNIVDSGVTDVGYAGVIGADRIVRGDALYDGHFPDSNPRGDTYGPSMYLTYVPFFLLFGWSGNWDELPAAHAATIAFDLLALAALFLLGRAIRAGPQGTRLGVALAFAWAAYPYTAYVMQSNTNDSLIAALLALSLAAIASPPGRGALMGLAGAAKLAPLVLAPLFATATGGPRTRQVVLFATGFVGVALIAIVPFVGQVGIEQAYDRTLGFQFGRDSPFSIWGLEPSLGWLQHLVQLGVVLLAVFVALRPREKSPVQVAALGAAVVIALELALKHWFYLYIVWFLPFVLVALFAAHAEDAPEDAKEEVAGAGFEPA